MSGGHRVAVIGGGAWGSTLALVAARAGNVVTLWTRNPERAKELGEQSPPSRFASAARFGDGITVSQDPERTIVGAKIVLFVVPAQAMRETTRVFAGLLPADAIIVSAAKGLELGTMLRMTEVLSEGFPRHRSGQFCALSGPNLAAEIAVGKPSATVVAASDPASAVAVRAALNSSSFRVYSHDDVIGVEMGGALKNVIALGGGMADGLEVGDNAKAAFITRGLAEIARLGVSVGANPLTFAGLAGLGDLIATTASPLSRNRRAGELFARGLTPVQIVDEIGQVVEGFSTVDAARDLGRRQRIDLPITDRLWQVIHEGKNVPEAISELMNRDPRHEREGNTEPRP